MALVLEDAGGEPLERVMGSPMETGAFLRLAIGIAGALGKLHQRGLVHKDVKPANILVNHETSETRLTGFGLASRLPRERQAPDPPEFIAGTLAYMAPEQTGRMNRSIDSRSDLYALGVTLYQMLTGSLPFTATDPMEWVHCHIARKPVPPSERLENVPAPVSAIIMKLLVKTAEDRYQTAGGVGHDLRRCLAEWKARAPDRRLPARRTRHARPAPRSREALRARARSRDAACRLRPDSDGRQAGAGAGFGVLRRRQVLRCERAAQGGRAAARPLRLGEVRPVQARHPVRHGRPGVSELIQSLLGKSEAELARWRAALLEALGRTGG